MNRDNGIYSVAEDAYKKVSSLEPGSVFFPEDISINGTREALLRALQRMADDGLIVRLASGIYLYPKKHPLLGTLQPTLDEIASAIAMRDGARLIPDSALALNKLGLSTQVPMRHVYRTDGSPRIIKIGKGTIEFKKISPRLLKMKGPISSMAVVALRAIGQEAINDDVLKTLKKALASETQEHLLHDANLAPLWIGQVLKNIWIELQARFK